MQSNPAPIAEGQTESAPMSFSQKLAGMYLEPQRVFEDIGRKPSWIGIFIIIALLGTAASYVVVSRMDRETYLRKGLEMSPLTRQLSEEQKEQIIARPPTKLDKIGPFLAPLSILVAYAVIALVFFVMWAIMGAGITYRKTLAVTFWACAPPSVVVMLLTLVLSFAKDPNTLEINPVDNIVSNLGILVDAKEHAAAHSLLSSIDVFSAWTVALLSIGFAAVSSRKLSRTSAAIAVLGVWLVWVLGKAGYAALLG